MRYADTECTYREVFNPHGYEFTGHCVITGLPVTVFVKSEELFAYRRGKYIQDALISNTADEREFLMTGISAEGWMLSMGDDLYDSVDELA